MMKLNRKIYCFVIASRKMRKNERKQVEMLIGRGWFERESKKPDSKRFDN
jgi:hypothetical protein